MGGKVWKSFMAKLYGFGASVVIVGAMFKIMHWPGAGPMLVAGLSTEAIIFFFSAFEPPHEEVDCSLVYPELAGMHGEEGLIEDKGTITEQLDNLLEEAKIGPELIASLGTGLKSLSDQTGKLTNMTDASAASNDLASKMKSASQSVGSLSDSYEKAKDSVEGLSGTYNNAKETIKSSNEKLSQSYGNAVQALDSLTNSNKESQTIYGQELQKTAKNLSALNASYELHLQSSNEHLKTTGVFYDGLSNLMKNLNESVEDTKKYKEQISLLSTNLEALNTVYGNMLSAMRK